MARPVAGSDRAETGRAAIAAFLLHPASARRPPRVHPEPHKCYVVERVEQEVQGVVEEERAEVAAAPASESVPENPIAPHWLRLGLAVEFLVALIAVTVTWEEIGGQGHLDLMPWYLKLAMIGGFCWAFVRFSAALARPGKWRKAAGTWSGAERKSST